MNLQRKITVVFFVLLFALPIIARWHYLNNKPKRVPILPREEITITIIPGWNLRDVADYLVNKKLASTTEEVYLYTGKPVLKPTKSVVDGENNYEGMLAPETYRVYADAKLEDIVKKLIDQRNKEFEEIDLKGSNKFPILIVASLVEKEAKTSEDRKMVADIIWRRYEKKWALQLDSTVHYVVDKSGTVFTTDKERSVDSLYNTYKYPGLPPGPICNPSLDSIEAALTPTKNDYWYFLSGNDGKMHYAKTLEEHAANRYKYLR